MKTILKIFLFCPLWTYAQDITGVWKGYIRTPGSQLDYELAISYGEKRLEGYSLLIYLSDGIENVGIKTAKIRQGKQHIYFEDDQLVYDNFTTQPRRVKMFGELQLLAKDTSMILRGSFSTRSVDFRDTRTYSGEVFLQKTKQPLNSKLLVTMEEINLVHNLSFVRIKKPRPRPSEPKKESIPVPVAETKTNIKPAERTVRKIGEIIFTSDSLQLSFYDNGTIDGDTISMTLNGITLAEKIKLTTNAYRLTIPSRIDTKDSLILVLHAESLGLIPPNTGLLIIQDGNNRHEIRFEGDMQKSSAVVLRKRASR